MCLCGSEKTQFRNELKSSINAGRYTADYLLCGDLPYPAWKMRIPAHLSYRRIRRYLVWRLKRLEARDFSHVRIEFLIHDMRNTHLCTAETLHEEVLNRVQGITGKTYLFFDEIQEVAQWEKCINSFRVEFDCDIYITGSNAKLLSGELTTVLGGRYVEFTIYPFSFAEFKELYSSVFPDVSDTAAFQKYLILGGMPYLGNLRYMEEPAKQYLKDIYNSVVLTDVVRRNKIRDIDLLGRIVAYVIGNVGTTFSANSIVEFLKSEHRAVAADTVMNYIKYCTNAYLFYQVKRQNLQGKQILATNEKYYMADHGIREAVFGGNMKDINLILENIIFILNYS